MDLNADLGEGGEYDAEFMGVASSVNIACGGHAGNETIMHFCIQAALHTGAAIGAHPGYEDTENFGRKPLDLKPIQVQGQLLRQLERILGLHPELHHVKPHGALYLQANANPALAEVVVATVQHLQPNSMLYCPPTGELCKAAEEVGLKVCAEGFIDRGYLNDGSIAPREDPEAVIEDFGLATAQAMQITMSQTVESLEGEIVPLAARTLCVHSDNPDSLDLLTQCRQFMERAGVEIRPL
ncbi:MAG: LamB/YcsF family protein [Akkermansiaceae bacterium]|nr:LamB/YcsF family protein [Akkermansiaceae bacterium]